jgi:Kef-type K+ transport system membrane component KefB
MAASRLDVAALLSDPIALAMVPIYAILMLATRGLPTLLFYRADLKPRQCFGLALHLATQISVVVAITSIAVHRGMMPGAQGAALVGGGILTTILYPAMARRFLREELAPDGRTT